jgi:hypothetical protein
VFAHVRNVRLPPRPRNSPQELRPSPNRPECDPVQIDHLISDMLALLMQPRHPEVLRKHSKRYPFLNDAKGHDIQECHKRANKLR